MCGRFGYYDSEGLYKRYDPSNRLEAYDDSYNIAPGQMSPVITRESPNKVRLMKWGLVPFWSKEPKVKFSNINSRSENVASSPAYRVPIHKHRCLIPTNHFFEWSQKGIKQPYLFRVKSEKTFSMAGIFDIWRDAEGKEFLSYAIMTTSANKKMESVHHRMPVILKRKDESKWVDPDTDFDDVMKLLKPYPESDMEMWPVSKAVNKTVNDSKEIIDIQEQKKLI